MGMGIMRVGILERENIHYRIFIQDSITLIRATFMNSRRMASTGHLVFVIVLIVTV